MKLPTRKDVMSLLQQPAVVDLVEEGVTQSVRALSDERQRYIARAVVSGITSDELNHLQERQILDILNQLNDREILILDAYRTEYEDRGQKFSALLPEPVFIGADEKTVENDAYYKASLSKLERLTLLYKDVQMNRAAEEKIGIQVPEFENHGGDLKGHLRISALGRLLLRKIGFA